MATPFLAQIDIFSFNFAPRGYAQCNGQLLPINQNQALFSLLGTTFGGDGRVNFGLPDLRSRVPNCFGTLSGGSNYLLGQLGGEENHTVIMAEMPQHNHALMTDAVGTPSASQPATNTVLSKSIGVNANGGNFPLGIYGNLPAGAVLDPRSIASTGGSQAHTNIMPYLTLCFAIALQGIFPSQN